MRNAKYIVRADGNAVIGAGHLMRCLTIMEALALLLGGRDTILFLCADVSSAQLVQKKGFQAQVLHTDYQDMESELPLWKELFETGKEGHPEKEAGRSRRRILVDSYYVTKAYLTEIRSYGKVFLLDDLQEKKFPADAVINYNAFADTEIYRKLYGFCGTQLYIGSSFVPLRSQFQQVNYSLSEKVKNVLITTGGGDRDNIAGRILNRIYREDVCFHLVVGSLSPNYQELKELEKRKKGIVIHHDVQNMAELMKSCDAAVTAGGSTVYELAAIGVPLICFSYAKNQEALVNYIGTHEIAGSAGAFHENEERTLERLEELFSLLNSSFSLRKQWSGNERKMIDCRGALRLAEALI